MVSEKLKTNSTSNKDNSGKLEMNEVDAVRHSSCASDEDGKEDNCNNLPNTSIILTDENTTDISTVDKSANTVDNTNDFVIRDGFPALRLPGNSGWNVKDHEPIPNHTFKVEPTGLRLVQNTIPQTHDETDATSSDTSGQQMTWESLWTDSSKVFTARTRDDDAAYSVGTTYFCPSQMKPRCALEAIALSIFQMHTKHLAPGIVIPEQSGAEWWTLVMDTNDDIKDEKNESNDDDEDDEDDDDVGMHFDADYGLEEQAPNLLLHPRLATVTYLTSVGTPTLILDQQSPPPADTQKQTLQGSIRKGWLSHPVKGKHISFDGRLLHGAPSSFFPPSRNLRLKTTTIGNEWDSDSEPPAKKPKVALIGDEEGVTNKDEPALSQQRITLLVNIWINHCPLDAEPLEDEIVEQLNTPWRSGVDDDNHHMLFAWNSDEITNPSSPIELSTFPLKAAKPSSPNSFDLSNKDEIEAAGEEEVVIGGRLVTISYGATMEDFHSASIAARNEKHGCIELELGREVIALSVGEVVDDD
jgi:hypothetical protein